MKHKTNLFIIGFLIIVSWYKIILTTFTGEGYYYFSNGFFSQGFPYYFNYDEGARLLFDIFKVIFRDNIFFYHLFLLIILVILGFVFYFMVNKLTNNKNISLISSIIFTINSWTLFEFLGMGAYQEFAQRLVWFPLLFTSFVFFIQHFKTKKNRYFVYSIVLYALSLYLAEFSVFFLPFYLTYVISFYACKRKFNRQDLIKIYSMLAYIIVTFIIMYLDAIVGRVGFIKGNFIVFLFVKRVEIADLILRQLVILTIPSQLSHSWLNSTSTEYLSKLRYLYIPVLTLYLGALLYILKKVKNLRVIALSSLIFIPIVFILNIFLREEYMLAYEDGGRYMFVPSIGFAIFWSIFFYTFCRRIPLLKIGSAAFLLYWIFMNIGVILAGVEGHEARFKGTKISLEYIKSISPQFSDDSIIIIPSVLGDYGPDFVRYFYAKKNNFVAPYFRDWQNEIKRPIDPKKDFILKYDYEKGLIDETNKFNEIVERRKTIGSQDIQ